MMVSEFTASDNSPSENHGGRTLRLFTLALLTLMLPWLTIACGNELPAPVAPALNQPTFVWIFSDP